MENRADNFRIREITPDDNAAMAVLVRDNLKHHGLDIPGTVYFDPCVDDLYTFYAGDKKQGYYVLVDDQGAVVGGIGFAEFPLFENCAEMQKLYLAESVKGHGLGYRLIEFIEKKMREAGYKSSYLETHSNLQAAIHIYEKSNYLRIDAPGQVVHGAMDHFYYKPL